MLTQDVEAGRRQSAVQFGQNARLVPVDVQQAVSARHLGQLHVRQVDAEGGVAPIEVAQQPLGRELGDGFLRLLGRAADVGRQDDVLQPLQRAGEGVGVRARLFGEDIHRRAGDPA
ncbi:hypothetical protein D3C85_791660 [compost metagenome]